MRNAFIEELVELARHHNHIALVVGDLGYTVVEPFADQFPDRFINAGIAEQNMITLSAGMASEGYHVFTYSIANFPTFRCAEQIRNDIDYQQLPVTVVTVGGGLAYGALGYSHHAIQDYALVRTMPNMLIAAPGDSFEVRGCLRYLVDHPQPSYIRLGKSGEKEFHKQVPVVSPGTWQKIYVSNDRDLNVLTTGAVLEAVVKWSESGDLPIFNIYSCPMWSMRDKRTSIEVAQLENIQNLVSIEDHLLDGGFGSWFNEAISKYSLKNEINFRALGLDPNVCGEVGSQSWLNELGGLTQLNLKNQFQALNLNNTNSGILEK
jgi:transketolase